MIGLQWVQDTEADEQGTCIHRCAVIGTGRPYATEAWVIWMVAEWSIQAIVCSLERPKDQAQRISDTSLPSRFTYLVAEATESNRASLVAASPMQPIENGASIS